jgi:hypothetical protein
METSETVLTGKTLAFLAECCQGNWTMAERGAEACVKKDVICYCTIFICLVWCHDSLHFRHLSKKWSTQKKHQPLGRLLQTTGSQLCTFHNSTRIFIILTFNVRCQLLRSASATLTATRGHSLFHSAGWETPRSYQLFQTEASSGNCSDGALASMLPLILSSIFFTQWTAASHSDTVQLAQQKGQQNALIFQSNTTLLIQHFCSITQLHVSA